MSNNLIQTMIVASRAEQKAKEDPNFGVRIGIASIAGGAVVIIGSYVVSFMYGSTNGPRSIDPFEPIRWFFWFLGLMFIVLGIVNIVSGKRNAKKEAELRARIFGLSGEGTPAKDFLENRSLLKKNGDITGVYVLHNKTAGRCYVGQSIKAIDRANAHLTGHGNGDVYADFKYGNDFEVNIIPLNGSGYNSLNDLERETIRAYDAYTRGYNRTRGNQA